LARRKKIEKKPFEQLTITDNYMFQTVMHNPERVKPLLEMILCKKIKKIVFVELEKTQETGYKSRGIRCDVYIEDDENTVYDVEMQASKKRHLGKRFRYYQSAIDVGIVTKGESVGKLKNSYIIFITTYDPFGKGWYVYPFETVCIWDLDVVINDAASWYILNTTGTKDADGHEVSSEIKEMLAYMNGGEPESQYAKMLDEAVQNVKQSEERRLEYMSINANVADEREVGNYSAYVKSVRDATVTDDILVAVLKIEPQTINNIRFVIRQHPDWDDDDVAEEVLDMEDAALL
jgi:predicted transposase/invertase (TIGR01784 family)